MFTLQSTNYSIEIGSIQESTFASMINNYFSNSKIIILVDENTKEYCLEYLITSFRELSFAEVIELPSGEENKQLEICIQVWETLTEYQIDRNALIINLGGGVISDMGGLIASLYKRGITFVNIPTTLLAMVDASVGGKTAVDLGVFKNQIGLFSFPFRVFIDPAFLSTLDKQQYLNGVAEMLKHGLIRDENHWNALTVSLSNSEMITRELIYQSITIKNDIVSNDPFEKGERKKLNFGHSIGHAIESVFLNTVNPIGHGYAVAVGMVIEGLISVNKQILRLEDFQEIRKTLMKLYPKLHISEELIPQIIHFVYQDKKNKDDEIKMVLLKAIGDSIYDITIDEKIIKEAILEYLEL